MAWFVVGLADWSLVETYDVERRAVSKRIAEQSLENSRNVRRIRGAMTDGTVGDLDAEEMLRASRRYGNHLGVEFGLVYESTAVVGDGTEPPAVADHYADYVPSATPGARAPHHWLGYDEARLSTLDLVGTGFTLLAGPDGAGWVDAARTVAAELGAPIDAYRVGAAGLLDPGDLPAAHGIDKDGAVLIRPDGHVAWRYSGEDDRENKLRSVVRRITAQHQETTG